MQYRWIGEIATAERTRLQQDLQSRLNLLRRNFDEQLTNSCYAFVPPAPAIEELGREQAYLEQYRRAADAHGQLIARLALAVPKADSIELLMLDRAQERFVPQQWPADWSSMRDRLLSRWKGEPLDPHTPANVALVELPRFASSQKDHDNGRMREQEWLILQLNLDHIRGAFLPGMLHRYLGDAGRLDYDAEVVMNQNPAEVVYRSAANVSINKPDGAVTLLDIPRGLRMPLPPSNPAMHPTHRKGPMRPFPSFPPRPISFEPSTDSGRGAWLLTVHHHAGSLEALVAQARRRNIAISGGILLLILAAVILLIRLSREQQQVAGMQMNFVAGVSHELRTPLAVIRTAAYNLRRKVAHSPGQVEQYGTLIQDESEKLGALVEQVLRYGNANAGRVIQDREPVAIGSLIEESLSYAAVERKGFTVERHLADHLPFVLADAIALKHALHNLLDNAVKYGTDDNHWIGVFASLDSSTRAVEIRVADHGPGIPPDERQRIFEPFFRGRGATRDQVHGTGLGLNLAKRIVEAHGGTIQVNSEPMQGTEFVIRIPAAPPEVQSEFAHSLS